VMKISRQNLNRKIFRLTSLVPSQHSPGETEENHENPQSG